MQTSVIHLHPHAPAKPAEGAACNGCGVCCAAAPCPLGVLISRRTSGPCAALEWHDGLYLCGAVLAPERHLPWLPRAWASALARRWIAAAKGCDSDLLV